MNYIIKGNLCGLLCEECTESIYPAVVLLYLPSQKESIIENTIANTKDTFRLVTEEEKKNRTKMLIAKAETDEKGNFEFSVDEKYAKAAFDIDFECGTVPRTIPKPPRRTPLQFHLTTFYPKWAIDRKTEDYYYRWDYCIPAKWWCYIRGNYFDAWVICGHLRNCETKKPIANATVKAWDADLFTDDFIGSATTDSNGHFRIDYKSANFKVNFIPLNLETDPAWPFFSSGPDIYFKAELGGVKLIDETSANRRDNVGYCLCVDLCSKVNVGDPSDNFPSAWTGVGLAFNVSSMGGSADFDADGYAGSGKYALFGNVRLTGQAAAKSAAGNPIEYRFLISNITTPNGGAAPALSNFTKVVGREAGLFSPSIVAKLMQKTFPFTVYNVESQQADFDTEGWFDINSAIARTQTLYSLGSLSDYWFIDEDTLITLNTGALTTAANVPNGTASAGDVFPVAAKIPIEKVAIRFEIREVVNKAANIFNVLPGSGKTLNSAIINNNSSFLKLAVQELTLLGDCSPVSGTLHAKYTVHHPHLQSVSINVHNNSGTVNKNLSDGFITLSSNINPAINAGNNNSLQINGSPNDLVRCTYAITIYVNRRLHNGDSQIGHEEQPILFFYDI
jgi:hypothetical protein